MKNYWQCMCCGLNLSLVQIMFFELISVLFAIVPDYGNEYMTKENKNCTSFKNFVPKLYICIIVKYYKCTVGHSLLCRLKISKPKSVREKSLVCNSMESNKNLLASKCCWRRNTITLMEKINIDFNVKNCWKKQKLCMRKSQRILLTNVNKVHVLVGKRYFVSRIMLNNYCRCLLTSVRITEHSLFCIPVTQTSRNSQFFTKDLGSGTVFLPLLPICQAFLRLRIKGLGFLLK